MKFLELLDIHGIQTFAAGHIFAHQPINLDRRSTLGQARVNHYGFAAGLRRKIAFMADANDLTVQPQREHNLRRRRQQRYDAHNVPYLTPANPVTERTFAQSWATCKDSICDEPGQTMLARPTNSRQFFPEARRPLFAGRCRHSPGVPRACPCQSLWDKASGESRQFPARAAWTAPQNDPSPGRTRHCIARRYGGRQWG